MIVYNMEQRTPEWHQIRIGKVTGSSLKKVLSKNWMDYTDKIVSEQLTGMSEDEEDGFMTFDMQLGIDREPLAIAEYEIHNQRKVTQVGFIQSDEFEHFGFSPDAIDAERYFAVEIKCPKVSTHIRYIRHNKVPAAYFDQILSYFVTVESFYYVDFVSYCPDLEQYPYFQIRTFRSDLTAEIEQAKQALTKFFNQVESTKQLLNL